MPRTTAEYYDQLSTWTAIARWFGYGGGHGEQTVHRWLVDPAANGRPTATRLHDLLVTALGPLNSPRVLDAGCGLGGTMIDLAGRLGGRYVGVTLSEVQAAHGRRAIERAGLGDRVRIDVCSYDAPPPGPFDLIIAIESLAHSPDPAISIAALARQLAPAGRLAIVDDMPRATARPELLGTFKRGWQCPVLYSREQFVAAFTANGLDLTMDSDLSPAVRPRPAWRIAALGAINRAVYALVPLARWRTVIDSYHGGLALERLYRNRQMDYRLLIAARR